MTYSSKTWGCKLQIGVCKNLVLEVGVPSNNPLALLICTPIQNISHWKCFMEVHLVSGVSHTLAYCTFSSPNNLHIRKLFHFHNLFRVLKSIRFWQSKSNNVRMTKRGRPRRMATWWGPLRQRDWWPSRSASQGWRVNFGGALVGMLWL
jgi:hypothetical protein